MAKTVKLILGKVSDRVGQLLARRDACIAADRSIESDLRSCSPPRSLFTEAVPDPSLAYITALVQAWIVDSRLLPDVHTTIDEAKAQCFLNRSLEVERGRAVRYQDLCNAYAELIARPSGENCNPGGGGGVTAAGDDSTSALLTPAPASAGTPAADGPASPARRHGRRGAGRLP